MDKPHVLWVEIGFGIAIAAFAAIVAVGQQVSTATYITLLLSFLAAFVVFTVFAEGAAHRAEHVDPAAVPQPSPVRGRSAPTGG